MLVRGGLVEVASAIVVVSSSKVEVFVVTVLEEALCVREAALHVSVY